MSLFDKVGQSFTKNENSEETTAKETAPKETVSEKTEPAKPDALKVPSKEVIPSEKTASVNSDQPAENNLQEESKPQKPDLWDKVSNHSEKILGGLVLFSMVNAVATFQVDMEKANKETNSFDRLQAISQAFYQLENEIGDDDKAEALRKADDVIYEVNGETYTVSAEPPPEKEKDMTEKKEEDKENKTIKDEIGFDEDELDKMDEKETGEIEITEETDYTDDPDDIS